MVLLLRVYHERGSGRKLRVEEAQRACHLVAALDVRCECPLRRRASLVEVLELEGSEGARGRGRGVGRLGGDEDLVLVVVGIFFEEKRERERG